MVPRACPWLLLALAGCESAMNVDPCPRGICAGPGVDLIAAGGGGDGPGGAPAPDLATGGGCVESWTCTSWMTNAGMATRTCADGNNCGTTVNKPPVGPLPLPA